MYPHERSLVQRMEGKPFALIGVNSDSHRDDMKDILATENITWRSFWNGGGTDGPISKAWQVTGWPTLFLIDHNGVIRQKFRGVPPAAQLDRMIDELVAAVPAG